jgi:hypothetical protein
METSFDIAFCGDSVQFYGDIIGTPFNFVFNGPNYMGILVCTDSRPGENKDGGGRHHIPVTWIIRDHLECIPTIHNLGPPGPLRVWSGLPTADMARPGLG